MRRKQQIQALQQELALLRQTVDSGKELAALAADAAGQLRRPGLRTVAVQVMRSPRVRRAALIAGGTVTAVTLGAKEQQYHCDGGEVKTYSAADVVVLYAAYKNYGTKHTTYCNLLKKWIKRETDNAVIGAIQYGDNLPEDLTAQMQTILDAATAQLASITAAVSDGAFADKISSLENQMTETQMALCDVYEQVIAATSATEG